MTVYPLDMSRNQISTPDHLLSINLGINGFLFSVLTKFVTFVIIKNNSMLLAAMLSNPLEQTVLQFDTRAGPDAALWRNRAKMVTIRAARFNWRDSLPRAQTLDDLSLQPMWVQNCRVARQRVQSKLMDICKPIIYKGLLCTYCCDRTWKHDCIL